MIPPKRFDIYPPVWDAQKVKMRSDFSLSNNNNVWSSHIIIAEYGSTG